ncbi:hypothetical protein BH23BAC2_BH23BAC2_15360 [soil metagenome]
MILIVNKYFLARGFRGVSLWPFLIVRNKQDCNDKVFMNHESIHMKQQLELLIIPFYVWYFIEFLWRFLLYRNAYNAYYNISFEREAYNNEYNLKYCNTRKLYGFMGYLKRPFK